MVISNGAYDLAVDKYEDGRIMVRMTVVHIDESIEMIITHRDAFILAEELKRLIPAGYDHGAEVEEDKAELISTEEDLDRILREAESDN